MKKILLLCLSFLLLASLLYLNLGRWIDVTQKPLKSDIIVCLGGGTVEGVQKSVELYKQGYSLKNKLLFIGENWYNLPYLRKHEPQLNYITEFTPQNTREEVLLIHNYMKKHHYTSALIVTDPHHSRRVHILSLLFSMESDKAVTIRLVSSGVKWWNREDYYRNSWARAYVKWELIKIPYNIYSYFRASLIMDDRKSE